MKKVKISALFLLSVLILISCSKKDTTAEHIKNKDVHFTIDSLQQTTEVKYYITGKLRNDSEKEIKDFVIPFYLTKKDGETFELGKMEYKPLTSHANIDYKQEISEIAKKINFDYEDIKEIYAEFESGYKVKQDE